MYVYLKCRSKKKTKQTGVAVSESQNGMQHEIFYVKTWQNISKLCNKMTRKASCFENWTCKRDAVRITKIKTN